MLPRRGFAITPLPALGLLLMNAAILLVAYKSLRLLILRGQRLIARPMPPYNVISPLLLLILERLRQQTIATQTLMWLSPINLPLETARRS
jgi:hypothetical protein